MKRSIALIGIFALLFWVNSCIDKDWLPDDPPDPMDFRLEMADLIIDLSASARQQSMGFIVVAMDGEALFTLDGDTGGAVNSDFRAAVDGLAAKKMFYGSINVDIPSPPSEREMRVPLLRRAHMDGKSILSLEYCSTTVFVDNAISQNLQLGFLPFASSTADCSSIPVYPVQPVNNNNDAVNSLSDAQNFIFLNNPDSFGQRSAYLAALDASNYDVLIINPYFQSQAISPTELSELKTKPGGSRRLVLASVQLGIAREDRYYWDPEWDITKPGWMLLEDPENAGQYFVKYWDLGWRELLYKGQGSMLELIIGAGFDGVMLEGADSYKLFDL